MGDGDGQPATTRNRLLGIKLLGTFFLLLSVVLICDATLGYMSPELRPSVTGLVSLFFPDRGASEIPGLGLVLDSAFALYAAVEGFGIWFLQRWARLIALTEIAYYFCRGGVGLLLVYDMDRKYFSSLTSSTHFWVILTYRIVVFWYLTRPDVRDAFGVPEMEYW